MSNVAVVTFEDGENGRVICSIDGIQKSHDSSDLSPAERKAVAVFRGVAEENMGLPRNAKLPPQSFFEQLAASARAPHCGGHYREWVQSMLLRATEAGLYSPEKS